MRNEMRDFLGQNNTKPEDIRKLAEQVFKNFQILFIVRITKILLGS